jgi:hypothetical protein
LIVGDLAWRRQRSLTCRAQTRRLDVRGKSARCAYAFNFEHLTRPHGEAVIALDFDKYSAGLILDEQLLERFGCECYHAANTNWIMKVGLFTGQLMYLAGGRDDGKVGLRTAGGQAEQEGQDNTTATFTPPQLARTWKIPGLGRFGTESA